MMKVTKYLAKLFLNDNFTEEEMLVLSLIIEHELPQHLSVRRHPLCAYKETAGTIGKEIGISRARVLKNLTVLSSFGWLVTESHPLCRSRETKLTSALYKELGISFNRPLST